MDQKKIGGFIAEKRKDKGYTQAQLAEKLGITDRAVSKWENGRSLPDSSIMLELCGLLGITVSDLLCGEVITMENHNEKLEKELLEVIKEKERADKNLLTMEIVIGVLSTIMIITPTFAAAYFEMEDWVRGLIIVIGFVIGFIGYVFAIRIEQSAGYYECAVCKHRYVPEMKSVMWSMHMGRTRYMRCPSCGKKSWQKKRIKK